MLLLRNYVFIFWEFHGIFHVFIVDGLNLALGVEPFFKILYKRILIFYPNIFHWIFKFSFRKEYFWILFYFLGENFNIPENNIISVELVQVLL